MKKRVMSHEFSTSYVTHVLLSDGRWHEIDDQSFLISPLEISNDAIEESIDTHELAGTWIESVDDDRYAIVTVPIRSILGFKTERRYARHDQAAAEPTKPHPIQ